MSTTRLTAEVMEAMKSTNDPSLQERRVGAAMAEYAGDPDTFDLEGLSPMARRVVHEITLDLRARLRLSA
ncbi:hypothetical protein HOT99_gp146 [Caulobacter phage CcrBL10]|uniref:Uncharacterized protein n=1 Tax=Caulobacter phage CcrBL10 TaxID=2283269 RepID=A0A385E9D0_9CAUD|nr:hypothetical protein HOT99_gp146 [Caulobacter phage CcrBL10]AXQ68471.1 hypothetical protein CcrBL10_gp267 [Caulobacter phage CcrBL10]